MVPELKGKKVLLGVTGGIAIYKVCDLVRQLRKDSFEVKVIMSEFASRFVSPMTFHTLSGNHVYIDWSEDPLAHIHLARWADTFLIAPATVNTLSKIATGQADNLLTTTALAYDGPLLIAPAANHVMLSQRAVRRNIDSLLRDRRAVIIKPEEGLLACDEEGEGKLASVERIYDWILWSLMPKPLEGKKVLVTAGSTREYIDPVRYLSNDSSGRMGFSLARCARWLGAEVTVVAGTHSADPPPEVELIHVRTASEMLDKVLELYPDQDIVIMNAAVSDFRPKERSPQKIKKKDNLTVQLVRNPDILEVLGRNKKGQFLVGFALETENILENAKEKLRRKNLDMIVANPPESMGSEDYRGWIVTEDSQREVREATKTGAALEILKTVAKLTAL